MQTDDWTPEPVALLALVVAVTVACFQVVTWFLHYRIRVKVLIYPIEGGLTVEVQNYSHDWTVIVEGLWIRYGHGQEIDVRHRIGNPDHRIEPHAACFATLPMEAFPFTLPTRLTAVAKIKTKRWKKRNRWFGQTIAAHPEDAPSGS